MQTFILLTRLLPGMLRSPTSIEDFEKRAVEHIEQECPEVKWLHGHALLGSHDYLEIFKESARSRYNAQSVRHDLHVWPCAFKNIGRNRMGKFQEHHSFVADTLE